MHPLTLAIAVTGGRYSLIMKKDSSVGRGYSFFFRIYDHRIDGGANCSDRD